VTPGTATKVVILRKRSGSASPGIMMPLCDHAKPLRLRWGTSAPGASKGWPDSRTPWLSGHSPLASAKPSVSLTIFDGSAMPTPVRVSAFVGP